MNGITFTCACCGRKKQTDWPEPQWALELAAWALDTGWHPLWGQNRGGQFVRLFCGQRCADANITKRGTLRVRPVHLAQEAAP